MSAIIDLEQIKTNLSQIGSESSPSETHGILCGVLCARADIKAQEWLSFISDSIEPGDVLAMEASKSLHEFFSATVTALSDNNLNFHPLLPQDETDMILLEAIAQWAQGFLMGLSLAGLKTFSDYSEDVTEFVEAMASISHADTYELADDESDEQAIVELIEFIRIGVLLVNEEMNPIRVPVDMPNNSIH